MQSARTVGGLDTRVLNEAARPLAQISPLAAAHIVARVTGQPNLTVAAFNSAT
jgi:hypothetical protein